MIDIKGIGSEGAIINLVISAFIIYQVYLKPKLMRKGNRDRRKVDNNPHSAPGNAPVCKENRDLLIELKTKMETVEKKLNRKR